MIICCARADESIRALLLRRAIRSSRSRTLALFRRASSNISFNRTRYSRRLIQALGRILNRHAHYFSPPRQHQLLRFASGAAVWL
jgi:hypothetical protein